MPYASRASFSALAFANLFFCPALMRARVSSVIGFFSLFALNVAICFAVASGDLTFPKPFLLPICAALRIAARAGSVAEARKPARILSRLSGSSHCACAAALIFALTKGSFIASSRAALMFAHVSSERFRPVCNNLAPSAILARTSGDGSRRPSPPAVLFAKLVPVALQNAIRSHSKFRASVSDKLLATILTSMHMPRAVSFLTIPL